MLIRFSVDSDVFKLQDTLDNFAKHQRLIQLWNQCGMLVIPAERETDSSLFKSIVSASPRIQKIWEAALKRNRKSGSRVNLEHTLRADCPPPADIGGDLNVAVISLEETRAAVWGLSDNEFSKLLPSEIEVCRFGHEDQATRFSEAVKLLQQPVEAGEKFERFWATRLRPLAAESRVISVCDGYLLDTYLKNPAKSVFQELLDGIARLRSSNRKIVHIYTAATTDPSSDFRSSCENFQRILTSYFTKLPPESSLFEIKCFVLKYPDFKRIAHYRYILFDTHNLVFMDKGLSGLSSFSNHGITQSMPVSMVPWFSESSKAFRDDLIKLRESIEHEICVSRI